MSYDWLERSADSEVESGHQCVTVEVEIVGCMPTLPLERSHVSGCRSPTDRRHSPSNLPTNTVTQHLNSPSWAFHGIQGDPVETLYSRIQEHLAPLGISNWGSTRTCRVPHLGLMCHRANSRYRSTCDAGQLFFTAALCVSSLLVHNVTPTERH